MDPLIAAACLALAFAIGSNDSSNSFGICVGCGFITMKRASTLIAAAVPIGLLVASGRVIETVGGELAELDRLVVATCLTVSALAIVAANFLRNPVSSHQAVVASLVGSALALGGSVNLETLYRIIASWAVSPIGAFFFAILIYSMLERLISGWSVLKVERVVKNLLIFSGLVVAFNTGANELATAMAPAIKFGSISFGEAVILGSLSLFAGARIVSMRVAETVGKGITYLDPISGLAAQLAAGSTVLFFTYLGMPVSTTYCVVGAVVGVGMYKSSKSVRLPLLKRILASWILTPLLSCAASWAAVTIFQQVF